jgi:pyruvate/2-oxoglutarate dehydrogenase complex dihydrolipoamide dehydrogenase (E3) component
MPHRGVICDSPGAEESGIDVRFGRSAARVDRPVPAGPVTVHIDDGSQIEADEILLGLGRRPAVDDLGMDTVGLPAHGPIKVDSSMLRDTADDRGAPQVIFTDPQICMVGRTESQARADGYTVRAVNHDMATIHGAYLQAARYTGRAKMVIDHDRHIPLGVTFVGPATVDLLHSATIAVNAEIPLHRLWHAVPSFPTVSEIWLHLLEDYGL